MKKNSSSPKNKPLFLIVLILIILLIIMCYFANTIEKVPEIFIYCFLGIIIITAVVMIVFGLKEYRNKKNIQDVPVVIGINGKEETQFWKNILKHFRIKFIFRRDQTSSKPNEVSFEVGQTNERSE